MYTALPKSYKNVYPFKIGTTSYIYPDTIIPNIRMLGPHLDEIELLLFESMPHCLPSKDEIKTINSLAGEFDLTYNVHLPIDVSLSDHDPLSRRHAIETIKRVIDLIGPLVPSTCTLHLSYDEESTAQEDIKRWQELLYKSMETLLGTGINGQSISVETLTYPLEWIQKIINDFHLSVCLDIGHLFIHGFEPETIFKKYSKITPIIHLHGVENGCDHLALDRLSTRKTDTVMSVLQRFKGVVSLEVFSYPHLTASLAFLEECWKRYSTG